MSLDGLRAWIGLVERKLTMRTRVFLVLVAIAIGGAGAGIYLAIDAQDSAVSKSDLEAVHDELAGEAGGGESVAGLEAELATLRAEVAGLQSDAAGSGDKGSGGSTKSGGTGSTGEAGGGATVPRNQEQLEELVEQAEEKAGK